MVQDSHRPLQALASQGRERDDVHFMIGSVICRPCKMFVVVRHHQTIFHTLEVSVLSNGMASVQTSSQLLKEFLVANDIAPDCNAPFRVEHIELVPLLADYSKALRFECASRGQKSLLTLVPCLKDGEKASATKVDLPFGCIAPVCKKAPKEKKPKADPAMHEYMKSEFPSAHTDKKKHSSSCSRSSSRSSNSSSSSSSESSSSSSSSSKRNADDFVLGENDQMHAETKKDMTIIGSDLGAGADVQQVLAEVDMGPECASGFASGGASSSASAAGSVPVPAPLVASGSLIASGMKWEDAGIVGVDRALRAVKCHFCGSSIDKGRPRFRYAATTKSMVASMHTLCLASINPKFRISSARCLERERLRLNPGGYALDPELVGEIDAALTSLNAGD